MKRVRVSQLFLFFLIFNLSQVAFSQVDPSIDWKVWRLPHFDLIFDAKHQELAKVYAFHLEKSREQLRQYFELVPEKTLVILNDRTDLTNGYATPIPRRLIMLYPVLPSPMDSIGEFGNWSREISMHEYTHILSFEPKRGVVQALRYVYGSIINANILLPRWWLEGIAVDMETRNSEFGRLRSTQQDSALRALALSGRLNEISLAEINETSIHTWPQGARPYLFGSLVWSEMIEQQKLDLVSKMHWRYGGRVPFFIEGPAQDHFGKSYDEIFEEAIRSTTQRVLNQHYKLKTRSFTKTQSLELPEIVESFSPSISPDGLKMAFLSKNETTRRSLQILERPSTREPFSAQHLKKSVLNKNPESSKESLPSPRGEITSIDSAEDAPPAGSIQRASWFTDSKRFVYDKVSSVNQFYETSDLYIYDLVTTKTEQLTKGLRAREPVVSPDGKRVLFVRLLPGTTGIGIWDLEKKQARDLYIPAAEERISSPVFLNEKEVLYVSRRDGRDDLTKLNIQTGQRTILPFPLDSVNFLKFKSQKLYFVSSDSGVPNFYVSEDLKTARPLTHSPTGIFTSDIDSSTGDLYLTEMTAHGFELRRTAAKEAKTNFQLPNVKPLMADRYPAMRSLSETELNLQKYQIEDYQAYEYLLPQYWFPYVTFDSTGYVAAMSTAASDPLSKHAYGLDLAYDSKTKETNYLFQYTNNTTSAALGLAATEFSSSILAGTAKLKNKAYFATATWALNEISTSLSGTAGWSWNTKFASSSALYRSGPFVRLNYLDFSMAGAQVSPESGWGAMLMGTYLSEGNSLPPYNKANYLVQNYFSKWLPKRHVLFSRLQGQYTHESIALAEYETHSSYAVFANSPSTNFILRGYPAGYFLGKTMNNFSLEYRAPLSYLYRGAGTTPLFFKRLHGALVADALQLDGLDSKLNPVDKGRVFVGTGVELKLDFTLGYHLPLTMVYGMYRSESRDIENYETIISFQSN